MTDSADRPNPANFSDVDATGNSDYFIQYLGQAAALLATLRREDLDQIGLQSSASVLDVGCGAGEVCVELARRVGPTGRVVGVDVSHAMVEAARKSAAAAGVPLEFQVASAERLPFADQSFDVTRAERVFQHLANPVSALAEMTRVTRVGGQVTIFDPDHGQCGIALDDPADRATWETLRTRFLKSIANPHSGTRLAGMMKAAGLAIVRVQGRFLQMGYPDFRLAFALNDQLAAAVQDCAISQQQANAFQASLESRHAIGTFFTNAICYTVVGKRMA